MEVCDVFFLLFFRRETLHVFHGVLVGVVAFLYLLHDVLLAILYHVVWRVASQLYLTLFRSTEVTTGYFFHIFYATTYLGCVDTGNVLRSDFAILCAQ